MFYNFKSNDIIQDVITSYICPIVADIKDEFNKLHRYDVLAIYSPAYIANEILYKLLCVEDVNEFDVNDEFWIHDETDSYLLYKDDNDVIITIGYDGMIFIEDARFNNGCIKHSEATLSYVFDEFSRKDVLEISDGIFPVLVFGFEYEFENKEFYNNEYDDAEEYCCNNTNHNTATKENYEYNQKILEEKIKEFEKQLNVSLNKYFNKKFIYLN